MKSTEIPPQQVPESELQPEMSQLEKPKNSSHKHQLARWLIAILIFGGGVALWQVYTSSSVPTTETNSPTPPPKAVEVVTLASGAGAREVELLGQVEAGETASISSQIDGTVQRVLVREGDRVTQGMTLAIIDDADPGLALAEARARLAQENGNLARLQVGTRPEIIAQRQAELESAKAREVEAKDNLTRVTSLTQQGALSQRALVEAKTAASAATSDQLRVEALLAEAQAGATKEEIDAQQGLVDAAQAVVQQAELSMQRTEIKAAFSGIVQSRDADPGDYVEVNDPVMTLVSDRSLDIFLEVPESLSGQVAPGMQVNLTARPLPNWQQETEITAVVPTANTASRRQLVRVSLNNPPQELLPGMAVGASLTMPVENIDTFVVPRDALTRRGERWLVYGVVEGQAEQISVEMVSDMGLEVAIASPDLQAGQRIVVKGGDGLTDSAAVKVINN